MSVIDRPVAARGERGAMPGTDALLRILVAGILLTSVHYADNYLYFDEYPQPASLTRTSVWAGWLLLTSVGIAGYLLYRKGHQAPALVCLVVYSYTGTSSLGHYLYGSLSDFTAKQHVFIGMDGLAGLAVLAFVVWALGHRGFNLPREGNHPGGASLRRGE